MVPNSEELLKEKREVNLINDHDSLLEMKFKSATLADIVTDHENRIRTLENDRVRKLEDQQNEWKGGLKTWAIIILVIQLMLNVLQFAIMKGKI